MFMLMTERECITGLRIVHNAVISRYYSSIAATSAILKEVTVSSTDWYGSIRYRRRRNTQRDSAPNYESRSQHCENRACIMFCVNNKVLSACLMLKDKITRLACSGRILHQTRI